MTDLIPQLDDSGNLVLKTKSVAIGSLNAPPSFVLGYIKNNYDLGKWAKINASKKECCIGKMTDLIYTIWITFSHQITIKTFTHKSTCL